MNKRIFQSIIIIGMIIIINLLLTTTSNATLSISTSKSTVSPGESFSVTVSVTSNEAGAINLSASNGTLSQTYVDLMSQTSVTISCVAGSSGTVTISGSGLVANYATETEGTQSASKSVTIKQPTTTTPSTPTTTTTPTQTTTPSNNTGSTTSKPSNNTTTTTQTKSSNSKLSSLQIAEGVLTPGFSSSVKEYAISVPNEITKLSISAVPDSSKATVKVYGNEELQVGENPMEIVVTAEDGSTTTYKLTVTRAEEELSLQKLVLYYINENGEKIDLVLNPVFVFNIYEYSLEKLPYMVKELKIETSSNKENAKIEILGNDELKAGANEITIKVIVENEDGLEEQKTYKITVEREEEPIPATPLTMIDKVKNWFKGAGVTVTSWVTENFNKIIAVMLIISTSAFIGLTIYFAYDYKNYQKLLSKLAEYNKENLKERANVAINPESIREENIETIISNESMENENVIKDKQEILEEKTKIKTARGKRFK